MSQGEPLAFVGRLVAKLAVVVALFALVLLVPAGTWRWPAAWVFLGLYLVFAAPVATWLFRTNPARSRASSECPRTTPPS